ncbi:NAD(P)H-dependent oxidoreductase [Corynebacterium mastitidis]|uniref:NAD(P)H-dependent oxidoreductase n=1 Tax=Corynebacterium mastitidis TaxID=161890 RepID=UPI00254B748D|nr:NAD(P)H-dependent oxidoreductase [Corynebacterium mastitidis]MDK8451420.1 NAD(P)H-dependent oxidoreductase [Corynebacterium mastitidis]
MNILLINAHHAYPNWSEGSLNRAAVEVARNFFVSRGHAVEETIIDAGYDPEEEVRKHLAAHAVILQTPANWFSAPWTWKKYADEVFNEGLHRQSLLTGDGRTRSDLSIPYGSGGKMAGRTFMVSATWNAPRAAFDAPDNPVFRGRSTTDAWSSVTAIYRFCGYGIAPDFNIFDIFKNPTVGEDLRAYEEHLGRHIRGEGRADSEA